jgi:hypothetical protein
MSGLVTPSRDLRRLGVIVLVVVAIAAGVASGRAHVSRPVRPVEPTDAAELPAKGALTTAWYCPGMPATFPIADQTVTLTNFGSSGAAAVVTVHPDNGAAPVSRTITVPRDSVQTFDRSTLSVASVRSSRQTTIVARNPLPNGPIIVEPFSPDVVVSAGLERSDALATGPCASTTATDWYFAAGTTVRGVSQWLVLDDPFAADARVDVSLRTDSGLQLLPALSGLDVPGRSRLVIPIHDDAVRQQLVAVEVHAAVGRVVASQTLQFAPASGPPGVATSIGAVAPASAWWFTGGDTRTGASEWVAIADVGELDARVNVQAQTASKAIVRPVEVTVPSGGVSLVRIGGCSATKATCLDVPRRTAFVLLVHSDANAPIVAQTLSRFEGSRKGTAGAATSMGSTAPARRWVIPRTRVLGERSTTIALTNPGVDPAHVVVAVVHDGQVDRPESLRHLTIASGERVVIPFGAQAVLRRVDAGVVITSDVPVFAESTIYAERDATRAPGIPSR